MEQRIDRLFASGAAEHLDRLPEARLLQLEAHFSNGGKPISSCRSKRICLWTARLALCLLASLSVALTLSGELVSSGYATQSTVWLAASDLAIQRMLRRVSHAFGLYDFEAVRNAGHCLVANPLTTEATLLCCGCQRARVPSLPVSEANLTAMAGIIDSLYSRSVSPFLVARVEQPLPSRSLVDFPRLASFVAANRLAFERGANFIRRLPRVGNDEQPGDALGRWRFADLFPPEGDEGSMVGERKEVPPRGQVLMWSFHHLSAARALRRLIPRPPYFAERTERRQDVYLILAGDDSPSPDDGRLFSAGDFSGMLMLAHAMPLSGRLTARLAPKAACCPDQLPPPRSRPIALEPGQDLIFPTDCYELLIGCGTGGGPALVQISMIYNGAHQARKLAGRGSNKGSSGA